MLYGQIKIAELGTLAKFLNDHQGAIAGGLGGGLISGATSYLSADNNKLKKGLLGAIPGALAGGYVGNKYDNSNFRFPFINAEDQNVSMEAWRKEYSHDDEGNLKLTPKIQEYENSILDRKPWLWEKPFGVK